MGMEALNFAERFGGLSRRRKDNERENGYRSELCILFSRVSVFDFYGVIRQALLCSACCSTSAVFVCAA